jgi:hypothetical protein
MSTPHAAEPRGPAALLKTRFLRRRQACLDTSVEAARVGARATPAQRVFIAFGGPQGHGDSSTIYVNDQPLRKVGLTNLLASLLLVIRSFSGSHSSLPGTRHAMQPIVIHSVNGPDTSKFDADGLPDLQD